MQNVLPTKVSSALDITASVNSAVMTTLWHDQAIVQVNVTCSSNNSIATLAGSLDQVNWVPLNQPNTLTALATKTLGSANVNFTWQVTGGLPPYLRVQFAVGGTHGDGTADVWFHAKEV